ncbi:MAG: TonB-dependent receptor [Geminicoccaceae bacterium]
MAVASLARRALVFMFAALPLDGRANETPDDLTLLDLEDLMEIEVTSVSKKAQSLGDIASAIYVLTGEEIRRSGYTTIPDALRLVPGVSVARINADKWAIGLRGGQRLFSNKLLVLIDGRSVYWSLYSGVNWALQDLVMEDIDRIEVIRGPGASVWGANAVNGVINIITKDTSQTQGTHATVLGGSNGDYAAELRHGGAFGDNGHYRVYAKGRRFDELKPLPGEAINDAMDDARIGFRLDTSEETDGFSFQGQIANVMVEETFRVPLLTPPYSAVTHEDARITQGYLLGKWDRSLGEESGLSLQVYADSMHINDYLAPTERARYSTLDVEFNHRFQAGETHGFVWGVGYRGNHTDLKTGGTVDLDLDRIDNVFSAFVHDDITVIPERLTASVGIKLEHNDYTGFEIQPTARAIYRFDNGHSLWGAVSRAVRTPSALDTDANAILSVVPPSLAVPLPTRLRLRENDDVSSEELWAFEAGYRAQLDETLNVDIAGFANYYDDLVGFAGQQQHRRPAAVRRSGRTVR